MINLAGTHIVYYDRLISLQMVCPWLGGDVCVAPIVWLRMRRWLLYYYTIQILVKPIYQITQKLRRIMLCITCEYWI